VTVVAGSSGRSSPHVLLLYRDEKHRQARILSWVRQGLAGGEKILYATVPDDPLLPTLTHGDADAVPLSREGQISVVPSEELFPGMRQAELVDSALGEGYPAVRLSARADVGLDRTPTEQYLAVDELTDELCASLPVTALCQLDAGSASQATLAAVIDTHSGGVEDAQMRLHRRDNRVVLSGEVDFSSADLLTRALRSCSRPHGGQSVVVDLSELTVIDVAGFRALVVGTGELREAGGTVVLTGLSEHRRKVVSLLRIDLLPGVELS
jgi:anti-anti-sigma factor